ncbi:MAG TPA: hypothetical protein PKA06_09310 [Gemmatales bacterium]|nr:hypothetical protein [Gemmatales bacterium]HMP17240.1 hypothetical protein [Gemmatales bacterium]
MLRYLLTIFVLPILLFTMLGCSGASQKAPEGTVPKTEQIKNQQGKPNVFE